MSTFAQVSANQKNASHSTGPRTPEGKAASSQNAVKTGVTSSKVVLPFESEAEYDALFRDFVAQLAPATPIERLLVENVTNAHWRLRRVQAAQNSYLARELKFRHVSDPLLATADVMLSKEMQRLHKYETSYRREFESAWRRLQAIQKERRLQEQREADARRKAAQAQRAAQATPPLQNEPNFTAAPAAPDPLTADLLARSATDVSTAS